MSANPLDLILFAVLPYVATALAVFTTYDRIRNHPFTVSSLSAQFLENRRHFWGSVPFHYGILVVLAGHLVAVFLPKAVLAWTRVPIRLYLLEGTGLAMAILALFGLANIVARRVADPANRVVTSCADKILILLLGLQILSGIGIALFFGWGSSWFTASAAPYLWSLAVFAPRVEFVAPMPILVKTHLVGAWVLLGVLPYTRLIHFLAAPLPYLFRRRQLVRWYGYR